MAGPAGTVRQITEGDVIEAQGYVTSLSAFEGEPSVATLCIASHLLGAPAIDAYQARLDSGMSLSTADAGTADDPGSFRLRLTDGQLEVDA